MTATTKPDPAAVEAARKCSKRILGEGRWGAFHMTSCPRKVTVERDGKPYCSIHDPEKVAARNAKRDAEWKQKWNAKMAAEVRTREILKACEGLTPEQVRAAIDSTTHVGELREALARLLVDYEIEARNVDAELVTRAESLLAKLPKG